MSSFFRRQKNKPKTDLEKRNQCSVSIEISLGNEAKLLKAMKICFSLVTYKNNNLIALRLTNQVTEISVPWWLWFISANIWRPNASLNGDWWSQLMPKIRCLRDLRQFFLQFLLAGTRPMMYTCNSYLESFKVHWLITNLPGQQIYRNSQ